MSDVLEEYAISFFTLVEQSLQIDGYEYTIQAQIASIPHMKKPQANKILRHFQKLGQRQKPTDINKDRERLRKLLRGQGGML